MALASNLGRPWGRVNAGIPCRGTATTPPLPTPLVERGVRHLPALKRFCEPSSAGAIFLVTVRSRSPVYGEHTLSQPKVPHPLRSYGLRVTRCVLIIIGRIVLGRSAKLRCGGSNPPGASTHSSKFYLVWPPLPYTPSPPQVEIHKRMLRTAVK